MPEEHVNDKLQAELSSFGNLWEGGYYEGNPLDPYTRSTYGSLGFMSVLHATYLLCIKPYVNSQTISLEIGPGRGAWTKTLLLSKEVYALDALSAEHNGFFEYLGHPQNVKFFQMENFDCEFLPDDYFTYMFSFGCLCHVSFDGISQYAANLYPKLRSGANCFWMVADYAKFNKAIRDLKNTSLDSLFVSGRPRSVLNRWLWDRLSLNAPAFKEPDPDDNPAPGRWYDAGLDRTCAMLEKVGYRIVDPDVGTSLRDPIIHFIKP